MDYYIGLDIGTTHSKAVLMDSEGKVISSLQSTYSTYRPVPGYEEQEPDEVVNAILDVLKRTIQSLNKPAQLTGIGISSAMHSMLPVDVNGKPLARAMIWSDQRSQPQVVRLKASGTLAAEIYERTGTPIHPMSPLFKIRWMQEERPEIFHATAKFISLKEYFWCQLFEEYCIDYSVASATGLFDIRKEEWSQQSLDWAGISTAKLSKPVSPVYVNRNLTGSARQRIGLEPEVAPAWVIGSSDGALANLGSGCTRDGEAALTIGTSGAVRITATAIRTDPGQRLFTYHLVPGLFICGGAINNGGIALQWVANLLGGLEHAEVEKALALAEQSEPGADGLLFLPYLLGERAPVWDAEARGAWFGLNISHEQKDLARSVLEGICYSLRELIVLIEEAYGPIQRIAASGGFVQSDFWVQLLANITGKQIQISDNSDASAIGAIYVAMQATGLIKEWNAIDDFLTQIEAVKPDDASRNIYEAGFLKFRKMYKAVEAVRNAT